MKSLIEYSVNNGNMENLIDILKKIHMSLDDEEIRGEIKESLKEVVSHAGSPHIVRAIGPLIDSRADIDEDTLNEFAAYLDKNAIQSFSTPLLPQEILKLPLKSFMMLFPILPGWMWKY